MIRHVAALALVLGLTPSWAGAQSVVLTVQSDSASVHKAPSNGSPVIGTARRGAVLPVSRELGSWVRISWPAAQDGVGYMHVSMGTVAHDVKPDARQAGATSAAAARPARDSAPLIVPATSVQRPGTPGKIVQPAPRSPVYISPTTHALGLGGRIGGASLGYGATARAWRRNRTGLQLAVAHYSLTTVAPARVTSTQFEPSLLYSLPDRVSDSFWLRPYVGSGANLGHHTLSGTLTGDSVSDDKFGLQAFGGAEMTLAGVPRFALSAEVSYRWSRAPFAGVELGGLGVGLSGHWYVR